MNLLIQDENNVSFSQQPMTKLSLNNHEDLTFYSMPLKRDSTIMVEDENQSIFQGDREMQNLYSQMCYGNKQYQKSTFEKFINEESVKNKADLTSDNPDLSQGEKQITAQMQSQLQIEKQLEPFQKVDVEFYPCQGDTLENNNTIELTPQREKKLTIDQKLDVNNFQLNRKSSPYKFKVSAFLKIWKFYTSISSNTRIFSKLTKQQHDIINDRTSFFENLQSFNKISDKASSFYSDLQRIFISTIEGLPQIPLFMRSSLFIRIFEFIQAVFIIITIFCFSIIVFYQENMQSFQSLFQLSFYIMALGIVFNFNISDIKRGKIITSRSQIANHYLKTHFVFDILGQIPLLTQVLQIEFKVFFLKFINYLLVLFLITKLKMIVDRITFYLSYEKNLKNLIDLVKLISVIGLICHIFSLFWYGIAQLEIQSGMGNTWLHLKNLEHENNVFVLYIYSFYFLAVTMITVGYGDITPQNQYEILFTILTMFVTGFYYAYSLNKIGSILDNINRRDKLYNKQMQVIHSYMRTENVSTNLRAKISSYLKYLYKESNEVQRNNEKQIVEKLSEQLKIDLIQEVSGKYIQSIPFFKDFKNKNKIMQLMEECVYSPGEKIFTQGQSDDYSLYLIVKGEVNIMFENQFEEKSINIIKKLYKGNYFGENSFLTSEARECSAMANDFCKLYKIQKQRFMNSIKEEENDYEYFCMIRDLILQSQNHENTGTRCYSCDKSSHNFAKCPKTHYIRSRSTLILSHNYPTPHILRIYQSRKERRQNSLIIQDQIIQAAYLIHQNSQFLGILDNFTIKDIPECMDTSDIEEQRVFQELKEFHEKEIQQRNSNIISVPSSFKQRKQTVLYQQQYLKPSQKIFEEGQKLKKDVNEEESLKKIDEISEDKGNDSYKSSCKSSESNEDMSHNHHNISFIADSIQISKKTSKSKQKKLLSPQNNSNFNFESSQKSETMLDSSFNQEFIINDTNKLQNKRKLYEENLQIEYQQKSQPFLQRWKTEDLNKNQKCSEEKHFKQFEMENNERKNNNFTISRKRNKEQRQRSIEPQIPSSKSQGHIKIKTREAAHGQYFKGRQQTSSNRKTIFKDEKTSVGTEDIISSPSTSHILSPVIIQQNYQSASRGSLQNKQQSYEDHFNSQKHLRTQDLMVESSQSSPINSAKSFFNIIKRNTLLRHQHQRMRSSTSIVKGISSLQNNTQNTQNNLESLIDFMKKTLSDSNKPSLAILPNSNSNSYNMLQFPSNQESMSIQKNSDVVISQLLNKLQKKDSDQYQVIVNQEISEIARNSLNPSLFYENNEFNQDEQQISDRQAQKTIPLAANSAKQIQDNIQNHNVFSSILLFDVGKLFLRYFPLFNFDRILRSFKKVQLSSHHKSSALRNSLNRLSIDQQQVRSKKKSQYSHFYQSNQVTIAKDFKEAIN